MSPMSRGINDVPTGRPENANEPRPIIFDPPSICPGVVMHAYSGTTVPPRTISYWSLPENARRYMGGSALRMLECIEGRRETRDEHERDVRGVMSVMVGALCQFWWRLKEETTTDQGWSAEFANLPRVVAMRETLGCMPMRSLLDPDYSPRPDTGDLAPGVGCSAGLGLDEVHAHVPCGQLLVPAPLPTRPSWDETTVYRRLYALTCALHMTQDRTENGELDQIHIDEFLRLDGAYTTTWTACETNSTEDIAPRVVEGILECSVGPHVATAEDKCDQAVWAPMGAEERRESLHEIGFVPEIADQVGRVNYVPGKAKG